MSENLQCGKCKPCSLFLLVCKIEIKLQIFQYSRRGKRRTCKKFISILDKIVELGMFNIFFSQNNFLLTIHNDR